MRQLELPEPPKRGGKRKGAGRKPGPGRRSTPHRSRARFRKDQPSHVTLRLRKELPNLRVPSTYRVVKAALPDLASRNGQSSTNFLFLREGKVYFEGGQQALLESPDAYLKKFLV